MSRKIFSIICVLCLFCSISVGAYAFSAAPTSVGTVWFDANGREMKNDFEKRFANFAKEGKLHLEAAYSGNPEEAQEWKELLEKEFPGYEVHMDPLSLSISCHIGKGALAVAVSAYLPELEA